MSTLILGIIAFSIFHVSIIALAAAVNNIRVLEICYGAGKKILKIPVAGMTISLGLIPFGGHVTLKDTRSPDVGTHDTGDALNEQPLQRQLLVPLTGVVGLLALSGAVLQAEAFDAFVKGFGQIFAGAFAPLSTAQTYIANFSAFASEHGSLAGIALFFAKMAAFNCLPLIGANGGQVITILLDAISGDDRLGYNFNRITLLPALALFASWAMALGYYALQMF